MLTVRNATLNDVEAIQLLLDDLGYPATVEEVKTRLTNIYAHNDYKTLLAVTTLGEVAGLMGMQKNYFYEHNGSHIRVLVMVAGKEHRNKGVGNLLMAEAEKWAFEIGAKMILLNSGNRPERQYAFEFYKRIGYEIKSSGFVKMI